MGLASGPATRTPTPMPDLEHGLVFDLQVQTLKDKCTKEKIAILTWVVNKRQVKNQGH